MTLHLRDFLDFRMPCMSAHDVPPAAWLGVEGIANNRRKISESPDFGAEDPPVGWLPYSPHLIVRNSQFLKLLTLFPASFRLFKKLRATRAREFPFLLTGGVTYTELPTCICITTRADTARIEAELERLIGIEEARNANVPGLTSTRNKARSRVSVLIKSQHPLDVDADLSALVVTELALEFPSI